MKKSYVAASLLLALFFPMSRALSQIDASSDSTVPLCTVLASPSRFDGKSVQVSGLYRMIIHGSVLVGASCPAQTVNLREAVGYKATKRTTSKLRSLMKKDQFRPVAVVFRGVFRVAGKEQCFGQACSAYELEATELLSVQPA